MPLSSVLFPTVKIRRRFYSGVRLKETEGMPLDFSPKKKVDESPASKSCSPGGWECLGGEPWVGARPLTKAT